MHCVSFPSQNDPNCSHGAGRACYVSNFAERDAEGDPIFGGNPQTALNKAIAHQTVPQDVVATVAMVYDSQFVDTREVQFMVYGPSEALQNFAQLDSTANNSSVPNNCLICHGGEFSLGSVEKAHFLPFDVYSFIYSTQTGYSLTDQQEQLRKLNVHVMNTEPTPAIAEFVNGMYDQRLNQSNQAANNTWVPGGWSSSEGTKKAYNKVVKPFCRTCHIAQTGTTYCALSPNAPTETDLTWTTSENFVKCSDTINDLVCGGQIMPQAEHTLRKMWKSSARSHLVSFLSRSGSCSPNLE